MTCLLLEKEKEFHKLNDELEIRTKALMHEVDSVKRMQNSLVNETKQNQLNINIKKTLPTSHFGLESDDNWEIYEEPVKYSCTSGINKCLKTKITVLENELDEIKAEFKNKCNELKQIHLDYSKLEEEKNKLQLQSKTFQDQKEKLTTQVCTLTTKLQSKDTEMLSLRKENDNLKKEIKTVNNNILNIETKFNKMLEENEKSKISLKNAKQEEKDHKDKHKKQISELTSVNKRLEKQVTELTNGFRKQMLLVDNLKRQKMYLESAKLIQISEDEFSKILDWKPSETN